MAPGTWQLERIDPPRHRGERLVLDADVAEHTVGRTEESDVVLYTATASRDHARIWRAPDGRWWLEPLPGKSVEADGEPISAPLELCEGLSIRLGDDQLRCRAVVPEPIAAPPPRSPGRGGALVFATVAAALAGLIAAALLWAR